ncbi:MAG: PQQ-binding-like beta-propeller repeat protein, partial [Clostridia bacterium]|nr:PQQ-binding-like beta-propeller repeat protein [Clostridia bacterium]
TVIYNGSNKLESYDRPVEDVVEMPEAGAYITQPYGVMTYRGDAFRQNAAVGHVEDISALTLKWTAEAGSVKGSDQTYYGIGWTGQPAIIKWSREVRNASNIVEEKRATQALKEVIVAGMDGKIYFLDLADGLPTREAINVGYPMKGTPSLHPLGYPIMTVGQFARSMAKGTGDIGLRFYDLLTQKQVYMIDGMDGKMKRPYYYTRGAFDTSALIDPASDTLITASTNGMVYLTKLNTEFDYNAGSIAIEPETIAMKSKSKGQADKTTSVESSMAAYGQYIFYADLSGLLRCVDTSTLTTVWAVNTGDQVEAAISLDFDENGDLWLYTANTLQNRGKGDVTIRRFNALTGEESWAVEVGSQKNTKNKKITGAMASALVGQNELSDLVVFTLSNVSKAGAQNIFDEDATAAEGVTIALDKSTGEIVWAQQLDSYSYSSPVAVYDEAGRGWVIQASGNGTLYLLDGLTGEVLNTLEVEGTIEGSPAVYGNTLVIGTTGKNKSFIYGITLE